MPPTDTTDKDIMFASLYIGGPDHLRGNGKKCYQEIWPQSSDRSAETFASRKLSTDKVQAYIKENVAMITQEAIERAKVDAQWVLEQSIDLYKMSTGQKDVPEQVTVNGDKTVDIMKRVFNGPAAKSALELIGKNVLVKAFQEQLSVENKSDLADILASRQKAIEAKAE